MSASADDPVIPQGPYHDLIVKQVIDETHDTRSVVVEIPDALRELFSYRAGQFLTFRVEVEGKRLVRCYSLASSPVTDAAHKVTVKRVDDGRVSNWFNDNVAAGTSLEVMKPAGIFCLQDRETPVVLFGGGSGITPIISIIKTALETTTRRIKLVYANRDARSIIFKTELDDLVSANGDRLEIVHRLDDQHGFVDAALVEAEVAGIDAPDFYICGPGPYMDVVEGTLEHLGTPHDRIFIERFVMPDDGAVEAAAEAPSTGGPVATIHLDGATHEVQMLEGETLLVAARRVGLEAPFACEDGYCGCCMAMVKEGDVEMTHNDGGVDAKQIAQGWVLTCQGVPKTAKVIIQYPD